MKQIPMNFCECRLLKLRGWVRIWGHVLNYCGFCSKSHFICEQHFRQHWICGKIIGKFELWICIRIFWTPKCYDINCNTPLNVILSVLLFNNGVENFRCKYITRLWGRFYKSTILNLCQWNKVIDITAKMLRFKPV